MGRIVEVAEVEDEALGVVPASAIGTMKVAITKSLFKIPIPFPDYVIHDFS